MNKLEDSLLHKMAEELTDKWTREEKLPFTEGHMTYKAVIWHSSQCFALIGGGYDYRYGSIPISFEVFVDYKEAYKIIETKDVIRETFELLDDNDQRIISSAILSCL